MPIKTDEQLELQALHRVRDRQVVRRTAVMNQMRGFLLERGITMRKGSSHLAAQLQIIFGERNCSFSGRTQGLLLELKQDEGRKRRPLSWLGNQRPLTSEYSVHKDPDEGVHGK